ncbi:Crp/Fnr family transcriptional regulator [Halomonas cupida]|uniref:Crp/Fnr family transcriptional regulator n=1 Tax=Halomonas cupida TaxID=44933 RepID=UPI003A9427C8
MQEDNETEAHSCLYSKISHYRCLNSKEEAYLAGLERDRRSWPARRRIRRSGESAELLYVVRKGWLYSTEDLPKGKRHVRGVFLPGDIIGLSDITVCDSICDVVTATAVELCPVPKTSLCDVFEEAPSIAALFFAFSAIETAIFAERLSAAARLGADARLAHFLLQLHSRIRITAPENGNWFRMPLSQETIGDAIGLSQPYVNRTFSQLEDDGLLVRRRNGVELLDIDSLENMAGFSDRYSEIDQTWMPSPRI